MKNLGGYNLKSIDLGIIKLVKALNYLGIETRFSCSGHTGGVKIVDIDTGEVLNTKNILGHLNNRREEVYGTGVLRQRSAPWVTFRCKNEGAMRDLKQLLERYNSNSSIIWEICSISNASYELTPMRIKISTEEELIAAQKSGEQLAQFIYEQNRS